MRELLPDGAALTGWHESGLTGDRKKNTKTLVSKTLLAICHFSVQFDIF
jgi:hypothetical protein